MSTSPSLTHPRNPSHKTSCVHKTGCAFFSWVAALADPAVMDVLTNLPMLTVLKDPNLLELLADPDSAAILRSPDAVAALTHPDALKLLANSTAVRAIVASADLLRNADVLRLLNDPSILKALKDPALVEALGDPATRAMLVRETGGLAKVESRSQALTTLASELVKQATKMTGLTIVAGGNEHSKLVSTASGRTLDIAAAGSAGGHAEQWEQRGSIAAGLRSSKRMLTPCAAEDTEGAATSPAVSGRPTPASIAAARGERAAIKGDIRWLLSDSQRRNPTLEISASNQLADEEDDATVLLKWASLHRRRAVSDGPLTMEHLGNPRTLAHLVAVLTDGAGGAYPGDPILKALNPKP